MSVVAHRHGSMRCAAGFALAARMAIAIAIAMTVTSSAAALEEPADAHAPKVAFAVPWIDRMGCTPLMVTAKSHVEDALTITATSQGASATTVIALHPDALATTTLLLPPGAMGSVEVAWSLQSGSADHEDVRPRKQHRELDLAVVDGGDGGEVAAMTKLVAPVAHTRSGYGWSPDRIASFAATDLPDRWQAYPVWLSVLISAGEDARLAPEQRQALAAWARAGGTLWVCESRQLAAWQGLAAPRALDAGTARERAGAEPRDGRDDLADRLVEEISQGFDREARPVPGTEKKPTLGFVTIALAFAVVAGPLNLWWVARRRVRHLFLLTTPLLSLGTCLGLACWALVADGISVRRIATQVTLLDQRAQRAHAWTRCTYFAGLSVSRLDLDAETKALPFDPGDSDDVYRRERESLSLDWRVGQVARGAWIPARINRQLLFSTPRPERFRLQITRAAAGGGWILANGLGVDLQSCAWRDDVGGCWRVGALKAGASMAMEPVKAAEAAPAADPAADPAPAAAPVPESGVDSADRFLGLADPAFARGFGIDVERACAAAITVPGGCLAHLAAPFGALPGPAAGDVVPVESWVCGVVTPGGAP